MVALNLHSDVVDNGLNLIVTNASTVFMCNALPTTYAEASSTYKLGSASIGFNSPSAATAGDGRKITSNPITGGVITGTGTVSHWGVCDGSRLLAAGAIDAPEAVTDGWEFSLGALSLVLPFEVIVGGDSFPNTYSVMDVGPGGNDAISRGVVLGNPQKTGTSRRTLTFSCWAKSLGDDPDAYENQFIISGCVVDRVHIEAATGLFATFDFLGTTKYVWTSSSPITAGWHHYVIQIDTTQATPADRVKFFVDGVEQAKAAGSTYPTQNYETGWGNASRDELICDMTDLDMLGASWLYDEWACVDGQVLAPSAFADAQNKPKDLSAIDFGNNGYWLRFEEVATEAEMGQDSSGNGNNFIPSADNWLGNESTDVP